MMAMRTLVLIVFLITPLMGEDHEILTPFPIPGEGMERRVVSLPSQGEGVEDTLKVELLIGKTVRIDPQNRYFYGGRLETVTIPGWGYDSYVLRSLGPMAGTLMAIDPKAPKVDRFITLGGETQLLRYNSRLPLVVYVPKGVEVRYRIWRAESETKTAISR
jgi:ecotin